MPRPGRVAHRGAPREQEALPTDRPSGDAERETRTAGEHRVRVEGDGPAEAQAGGPPRVKVPIAILRKMYVDGSLANGRKLVTFRLRNQFSTATIVSFPLLLIDGARVAIARVSVKVAAKSTPAKSVRDSQPLLFGKNDEAIFLIDTKRLAEGAHAVQLTADTREWGRLVVDFEATI